MQALDLSQKKIQRPAAGNIPLKLGLPQFIHNGIQRRKTIMLDPPSICLWQQAVEEGRFLNRDLYLPDLNFFTSLFVMAQVFAHQNKVRPILRSRLDQKKLECSGIVQKSLLRTFGIALQDSVPECFEPGLWTFFQRKRPDRQSNVHAQRAAQS